MAYNADMLRTIPLQNRPSWQEQLADLITDPLELLALLQLQLPWSLLIKSESYSALLTIASIHQWMFKAAN